MRKLYFLALQLFLSVVTFAQRYDDYADEEDRRDFERYVHMNLSNFEIASIAVGIILLLIVFNANLNNKLKTGIGCVAVLALLPLLLVVLAVAQKIFFYGVILAIIVGGLWFLFGRKD